MDNLSSIIKVEYCFLSDIKTLGVDTNGIILELKQTSHWRLIPVLSEQIQIESVPERQNGTLVYKNTGTIKVPKQKRINDIIDFSDNEIILKTTLADNTELIYGDKSHPIRTTRENKTPNSPSSLANITIRLSNEDMHGALPLLKIN